MNAIEQNSVCIAVLIMCFKQYFSVQCCHIVASRRLSDVIRRPYDLYRAGLIDEYFSGLVNQVAQAMDDSITQEVCNYKISFHFIPLQLIGNFKILANQVTCPILIITICHYSAKSPK